MSQNQIYMRGFNTLFEQFIDDVGNIFQDDSTIKTAVSSMKMIKKANPKIVIRVWNKYVLTPYGDKIMEGDLDYFIQKDYSNDLTRMSNGEDIAKYIDAVRGSINDMSDNSKQCTLEYLQKLCKLCDAYWDGKRIQKDGSMI